MSDLADLQAARTLEKIEDRYEPYHDIEVMRTRLETIRATVVEALNHLDCLESKYPPPPDKPEHRERGLWERE